MKSQISSSPRISIGGIVAETTSPRTKIIERKVVEKGLVSPRSSIRAVIFL